MAKVYLVLGGAKRVSSLRKGMSETISCVLGQESQSKGCLAYVASRPNPLQALR